VYVEKPMTRYLDEAFEVHDAVKKTGKLLQVGSQYCSERKWHVAAEWVKAGRVGKVAMVQGSFMRNTKGGEWNAGPCAIQEWAKADDINWKLWMGDRIKTRKEFSAEDYFRWRKYYRYCSGLLSDLFPHVLHPYLLASASEEFPSRVTAVGSKAFHTDGKDAPERDVPEIVQLIAEFPSGMTMNMCSSSVNEQGTQDMIRGQKGTMVMGGNRVQLSPERPYADEVDPESSPESPSGGIPAHHKNLFDAIRGGPKLTCPIDLAIRVQTIVSLGEMSERLGIACYFDDKTRKVSMGDGMGGRKEITPITYGTLPLS
jgi:predicted dehydrogenase